MLPSKDKYPENIVNPNFQKLLNNFHAIVEDNPKPEKVKEKLEALKLDATAAFITGHQRDAIHARCNNYINGTYGSWAKEHKVHQHQKS